MNSWPQPRGPPSRFLAVISSYVYTASRGGHFPSESWCSKTVLAAKGRTLREPLVTWKVHDGGLESLDSGAVILSKDHPGVKMARNQAAE